jgi:hypothetical protein
MTRSVWRKQLSLSLPNSKKRRGLWLRRFVLWQVVASPLETKLNRDYFVMDTSIPMILKFPLQCSMLIR